MYMFGSCIAGNQKASVVRAECGRMAHLMIVRMRHLRCIREVHDGLLRIIEDRKGVGDSCIDC